MTGVQTCALPICFPVTIGAGNANAGSVSGGQAATAAAKEAVNQQRIMMGLEMQKLGAEVKVLKAEAKQKEVDAEKKSGIDTQVGLATLNKIAAETTNEEVKTSINRIQRDVDLYSAASKIEYLEIDVKQNKEELNKLIRENKIGEETYNAAIEEIKNRATLSAVEIALRNEQVQATKEQIEAIKEGIMQKWAEISNMEEGNRIKAAEAAGTSTAEAGTTTV